MYKCSNHSKKSEFKRVSPSHESPVHVEQFSSGVPFFFGVRNILFIGNRFVCRSQRQTFSLQGRIIILEDQLKFDFSEKELGGGNHLTDCKIPPQIRMHFFSSSMCLEVEPRWVAFR